MRFIAFFIASIISAMPTMVIAQHPMVLARLTDWNSAAPQPLATVLTGEVMKSALAVQKNKGGCLPTSAAIDSVTPATSVRFVFQGVLARQLKNAWTVSARHPNCGAEIVRYAVVQKSDDALYSFRINQGRSIANESLIGDTFPVATVAATVALKKAQINCDGTDAQLGITRIEEEESDLGPDVFGVRYKGSWREIWPLTMCGRTVDVGIRFTADGDGGAFHNIKGNAVTILPKVG